MVSQDVSTYMYKRSSIKTFSENFEGCRDGSAKEHTNWTLYVCASKTEHGKTTQATQCHTYIHT